MTRAAGATGSDSTLPVLSPTQLISQLLRSLYDENHMGEMLKRLFTQRYANGAFDHSRFYRFGDGANITSQTCRHLNRLNL